MNRLLLLALIVSMASLTGCPKSDPGPSGETTDDVSTDASSDVTTDAGGGDVSPDVEQEPEVVGPDVVPQPDITETDADPDKS